MNKFLALFVCLFARRVCGFREIFEIRVERESLSFCDLADLYGII